MSVQDEVDSFWKRKAQKENLIQADSQGVFLVKKKSGALTKTQTRK